MSLTPVNVLLVGATGGLGQNLLNGLTSAQYVNDFSVFALIRSESIQSKDEKKIAQLQQLKSKGVTIVEGDVNDSESSLSGVIRSHSIQVILSAVNFPHLESQINLINAAKAAGTVSLFIPSEFGFDIAAVGTGSPVSLFDMKLRVREALQKSGLNYLYIITGVFAEHVFSPFCGVDIANRLITAPGSMDTKTIITSVKNVGLNTAALILDKSVRNTTVYFGDATVSWADLKKIVEQVTGQQFNQQIKSASDYESAIAANPHDLVARFGLIWIRQRGTDWSLDRAYKKHSTPIDETAKAIIAK